MHPIKRAWAPLVALVAAAASSVYVSTSGAADHNDPIRVQAGYLSGNNASYTVATGDPSADIADIFAWYTGEQGNAKSIVLAMTWRADATEQREKAFDPSVQYTFHIDSQFAEGILDVDVSSNGIELDSNRSTEAEHEIVVWFGKHKSEPGQWGMLITGLPGIDGEVVGPVGKTIEPAAGVKIAAGLFDDAFFADLDAFFNSISVALNKDTNPDIRPNPSLPPQAPPEGRFAPVYPSSGVEGDGRLARPFGYPPGVDGFGKQNVHGVVIELPADAFGSKKLHVWATTARKKGLANSGTELGCSYDDSEGTYACRDQGGAP